MTNQETPPSDSGGEGRIQCHFISNTHWDREWRYSAQRTRHMLVYMLDMLFDILEKEPDFKSFHLDSQTLPIQDYLEARPEQEETVRKYVSEGRLLIGPWFCLPDEFCVGGESLIRNLLLGHRIAKRFGNVSKTGYSPFGWGQISQMPQIYQGFGIDVMSFYRGVNTLVAPKSEFIWQGPDGAQVIASRLATRPRYNVWYIIQRPVYWGLDNENERRMSWKRGHGPFRFIDPLGATLDYQYVHPEYNFFTDPVAGRADQAIREQDDEWSTPHRFWSAGHDSSCPDIREARMIAECDAALGDRADVFHSTVAAFQDGLRACKRDDWPVVHGEMRHTFTKGSSSNLLGWVTSARTYLKQDNFQTEQQLTYAAEPLAVFAGLLGAPYPQTLIDLAYNWLLQNHGHDSIGGCSRDIVHDDMVYRFRQAREISTCVIERAMMDVTGSIDLSAWSTEEMALVVYNPAPFERSDVIEATIEIPDEWACRNFAIEDETGAPVATQFCEEGPSIAPIVQGPNDVANTFPSARHTIRAAFPDVPGCGYRTFKAVPVKRPRQLTQPQTMLTGPQTAENEFLSVTINANGTLDILHKETGTCHKGLGYFRDTGETGDPWNHIPPQNDSVLTTLNERARVALVRDGALEVSFRVTIEWSLPECRSADYKSRSDNYRPYRIVNTITLRQGEPWVEIETEVDNTLEDHYLQVSFPTGIKADDVMVQGQFDVVARPIATPDYSLYDNEPQTEQPMNSFVDLSDGKTGFALLNEGLKGYTAHDDPDRTVSLTLLRGYPLRIIVTSDMIDYSQTDKGSQCLGRQRFRYAVMPHAGDWVEANVWKAAERFTMPFRAAQLGPTKHGAEPLTKSFLELTPDDLHVSAVKCSESGDGWVVRLFNPFNEERQVRLRLNGGLTGPGATQSPVERVQAEFALPSGKGRPWQNVRRVTLEEVPVADLPMDDEGWVDVVLDTKSIVTLEFVR